MVIIAIATSSDGSLNPKFNKAATDSDGYQIATHGHAGQLKEFAKKYVLGGSIGEKTSALTSGFEDVANKVPVGGEDGEDKIRNTCRLMNSPGGLLASACGSLLATWSGGPVTLAINAGVCACTAYELSPANDVVEFLPEFVQITMPFPGVRECEAMEVAAREAMEGAMKLLQTQTVQDWIASVLRELNVDDNTKGVDAGNAIAAGAGLLLSTTATGYGLRPAKTKSDVDSYISFTQPLEQKYIALEKDDAKHNPFDAENKYSLVGCFTGNHIPIATTI